MGLPGRAGISIDIGVMCGGASHKNQFVASVWRPVNQGPVGDLIGANEPRLARVGTGW